ncbi:MAG: YbjN domain-containing protein [Oscillochloridaceae bacterium]|nr:YbjN domain-containing protein [Chloroflexaceae bacterium]MDW8391645.1 YbjN domain-containing protein [Oscillochloridaceae bacterium]
MSNDPSREPPAQDTRGLRRLRGERALATLSRLLADDGWRPRPGGPGCFAMTYRSSGAVFEVWAEIIVASEQLVVKAAAPLTVPLDRRAAAAEYVLRATWGLYVGSLDLDVDSGKVCARCGLDFEGEPLSPRLIRNALSVAVRIMETYLPGLKRVIDGAAPAEAIRAVEGT